MVEFIDKLGQSVWTIPSYEKETVWLMPIFMTM